MTYDEYIIDTTRNCKEVLTECLNAELENIEYLRRILWEDDRVTGVYSGYCTSASGNASERIKEALFSKEFLADFNDHKLNMQEIMIYGAEAVDVVIRCLALKHINLVELAEKERERRLQREKEIRRNSAFRV